MEKNQINKDEKSDNLTSDVRATADTAEAEKEVKAAAVPEKFKDVQTLIKAYSDLEAEFTRRSQRLKELEKGNKAETVPDGAGTAPSRTDDEELIKNALSNAKVKEAVIGEYLKSVSEAKSVPVISGGGGVAAPRVAPRSVKEAGALAKQFFNN